ncbi:hypothetical protein M1P56_02475 [Streptomyces sp. HU2014]|uniref:Uncharacterized protein n=1 Tax=Streptomyces albireticuli TaxID=1940 RepID=A0A1Z2L5Y0_9ACTN|nr:MULTISPECIES: hypothetical protein [Streptomyces]ARZ69714.1 hypothetical protein SMD11_4102 [Streptomyces albireticuli]UQI43329.1 hypothetical protein M1P56_02475 [Streptomyces sp. HU2014]
MSHHANPHKQRSWFARHKVLTGAGALVVVVAVGAAVGGGGDEGDGTTTASSSSERAGAGKDTAKGGAKENQDGQGKDKKKADVSGNGTFQVGSDIKPGTYRSTGNKLGCYWERAKDSSGGLDSILANDNVQGASYVTVKADDKIFKTRGCKGWHRVTEDKAGATPQTQVSGNGMYRVGVDIAPGTYKAEGNKSGCYWERDKDALHEMDSIEANENVTGSGIVTLSPQDGYFKTNGCADWKKTG